MTATSPTQPQPAAGGPASLDGTFGTTPDFHHVSPNNAWAMEAYLHLYVDSSAQLESLLKSSAQRRAS